jgi:ATP-dependent Clp protease ATP-binding subunit ClpA
VASQFASILYVSDALLFGLVREAMGLTFTGGIFALSKVSLDGIRQEVDKRASFFREKIPTSLEIPFSDDAKQVLASAAEESEKLGHSYIGTEHVLLGLLHDDRTIAGSILAAQGLRLPDVRDDIVALLKEKPTGGVVLFNPAGQAKHIDHIKGLVEQLGHAANSSESRELAERLMHEILGELDAMKLPPGDWPSLNIET